MVQYGYGGSSIYQGNLHFPNVPFQFIRTYSKKEIKENVHIGCLVFAQIFIGVTEMRPNACVKSAFVSQRHDFHLYENSRQRS